MLSFIAFLISWLFEKPLPPRPARFTTRRELLAMLAEEDLVQSELTEEERAVIREALRDKVITSESQGWGGEDYYVLTAK